MRSGFVKPNEKTVLILTGNLLKDPDFTIKFHKGELFQDSKLANDILGAQQRAPLVLDANVAALAKVLHDSEQIC